MDHFTENKKIKYFYSNAVNGSCLKKCVSFLQKFHFYKNTECYLRISIKTLMLAFFDLVSPLLEIYPRVISTCIHKDICVRVFLTASISIAKSKSHQDG